MSNERYFSLKNRRIKSGLIKKEFYLEIINKIIQHNMGLLRITPNVFLYILLAFVYN